MPVGRKLRGSRRQVVRLGFALALLALAALIAWPRLAMPARSAGASASSAPVEASRDASSLSAAVSPNGGVPVVHPAPLAVWGPAPSIASTAPPPDVGAWGAVVLDEASATVLYQKDPHAHLSPASLTKIMTALVALERTDVHTMVDVTVDSRTMRGSTVMGLVPGERLSMQDLLYGLMLPSGNDAALAIAQAVGGSTEGFVALMNQRAAELGLEDTHFANPHGLDAPGHYTSAYDLALLTRAAMQRQDFRDIVNTRYVTVQGALRTYDLGTLNPLYGQLPGVDGVKTGYTRTAQQTFVGSVVRDGHRVYVVLLRSSNRTGDSLALLRWAFASWAWPVSPSVVASDGPRSGT